MGAPWSTLDGVEPPWLRDTFQVLFPAIDEADAGPGDEIDDRP
jgi:hypothetical protein